MRECCSLNKQSFSQHLIRTWDEVETKCIWTLNPRQLSSLWSFSHRWDDTAPLITLAPESISRLLEIAIYTSAQAAHTNTRPPVLSSPSGWGLVLLWWSVLGPSGSSRRCSCTNAHCWVNGASHAAIFTDRLKVSNSDSYHTRGAGTWLPAFLCKSLSSLSLSAVCCRDILGANMSFNFLSFRHLSVCIKIMKLAPQHTAALKTKKKESSCPYQREHQQSKQSRFKLIILSKPCFVHQNTSCMISTNTSLQGLHQW